MNISIPKLIQSDTEITINFEVSSNNLSNTLWYKIPSDFKELISTKSDCALIALLIPAMAKGEDIYIKGSVSEKLYYNVVNSLQHILKITTPHLKIINIFADTLVNETHHSSGVATGFSGGVDSFCTLADHYFYDTQDSFKITHLLFNNAGSHGKGVSGTALFKERYAKLKPVAEKIGLPFIPVNSNLDNFYGKGLGFLKTDTYRNSSVALLLSNGIGKFLYSSAYRFSDLKLTKTIAAGYTDLITLPLMSTDKIDCFSVGSQYTRVEKTLRISELKITYDYIDVCVNSKNKSKYNNCSECKKCLRTLATLDMAGTIHNYYNSFNLDLYYSKKDIYLSEVLTSRAALMREIYEYANKINYKYPMKSKVIAYSGLNHIFRYSDRKLHKSKFQSIK